MKKPLFSALLAASIILPSAAFLVSASVFDASLLPGADNTYDFGLTSPQRFRDGRFYGNIVTDTAIGVGTTTPASSALIDLYSTTKGFLGPRMTGTERDAIPSPATGLLIYNRDTDAYNVYNGTTWGGISGGGSLWASNGNDIYNTNSGNIGVGTGSPTDDLNMVGESLLQTPGNPVYVGGANIGGGTANNMAVQGRYAYITKNVTAGTCSAVSSTGCEFQIWDVTNPVAPDYVGGYNAGISLYGLFVSGRYAYVGTDDSGSNEWNIFDISNPSSPTLLGGANLGSALTALGYKIAVSGHYVYVLTGYGIGTTCTQSTKAGCELQIYDIANPLNPVFVYGYDLGDSANANGDVFVRGKYLYVGGLKSSGSCTAATDANCDILIFDITNPVSPVYTGGYSSGDRQYHSIFTSGNYMYAGQEGDSGACNLGSPQGCELQIFDVDKQATPTLIGIVDTGTTGNEDILSIYTSGRYLYLTMLSNSGTCSASVATGCELQVYDVSNPASPVYKGGVDLDAGSGDDAYRVFVSGRYAYIAKVANAGTCSSSVSTGCELQIFDVSGVESPSGIVHILETGALQVYGDAAVGDTITAYTGLNVGTGGIFSDGALGSLATSSPSYFSGPILMGTTTSSTAAKLVIAGQYYSALSSTSSAAITANWNSGNVKKFTLTGSGSATFSNPLPGAIYTVIVVQDGTGGRTVTWPAAVAWPGTVSSTLSAAAGAVDVFTFLYDGTNYEVIGSAYDVK